MNRTAVIEKTTPGTRYVWPLILGLLLASATASLATTEEGQASRVSVGQQAPPFSLLSSDGTSYSLSDLEGERNLVLIFFRGSW